MAKIKSLNPEMLDYNRRLKENIDLHAKWIRAEIKEIGTPAEHQLRRLKSWAREITDDVASLEGLVLRGEY